MCIRDRVDAREQDKNRRIAEGSSSGKGEQYEFDILPEEREKSKTFEFDQREVSVGTEEEPITLIDVPGHRAFVHEMISGASGAHVALVVVSARRGELEDGIKSKGSRIGQTIEHCLLLKALGVQQVVIIVNKMDTALDDNGLWSVDEFKRVSKVVKRLCKRYKLIIHAIIPTSAVTGGNIAERTTLTPWYTGLTVLEVLDELAQMHLYENDESCHTPREVDTLCVDVMYVAEMVITPGVRLVVHTSANKTVEGEIEKIKLPRGKRFINNKVNKPQVVKTKITLALPIVVAKGERIVLRDSERTIGLAKV